MRYHNHSFIRFLLDSILVIVFVILVLSPIFLLFTLKINNTDFQAKILESVAGARSNK
jgi:quinol-cytochrome oxidoreductase complex cytochrome b subunit